MDDPEVNKGNLIDYYERYRNESDSQILSILKNHKDYQETAVNAVVKIAIERGLIHSEQDLLSPEYQNTRNPHFRIFPEISNPYHRNRLMHSIFRLLYLTALIPVVFGVLSYAKGQIDRTFEGIGLGLVWALLCFLYRKNRNNLILILLFTILAFLFIVVLIGILNQEVPKVPDVFMLIVGIALPVYFLLYARQLMHNKSADE